MLLAFILGLFVNSPAQAQLPELPSTYGLQFEVNLIQGRTVGSYEESADGTAYGINVYVGRRVSPILQVGGELEYLSVSQATRSVSISSSGAPAGRVSVRTRNSVLSPSVVVRLQPQKGNARPYVQAHAGLRLLSTWMTDTEREETDAQAVERATFNDVALAVGIGAGIHLQVWRREDGTHRSYLNLGARYVLGQNANYFGPGDITDRNNDGDISRREKPIQNTRTDVIQPFIGFSWLF